ncbi:hypothetical protein ACF1HJ_11520 [Streptomyces sp. NPDC013978]|uniref:hypothetical protein n=1 Tax=Streptomyces sp. NPDC013978 TaxID=3364869 RepID=UPI0036FB94BB
MGSSPRGTADLNIAVRTAVLTEEGPHVGEEMLLTAATSPRVPLAVTSGQAANATPPTGGVVRTRAAEGGLR